MKTHPFPAKNPTECWSVGVPATNPKRNSLPALQSVEIMHSREDFTPHGMGTSNAKAQGRKDAKSLFRLCDFASLRLCVDSFFLIREIRGSTPLVAAGHAVFSAVKSAIRNPQSTGLKTLEQEKTEITEIYPLRLSPFPPFPPVQNSQFAIRNPQSAIRNRGIALVITLLMLSAITFLAVAFLVLTRTQRDSASVTLDVNTAQEMSWAAFARAQSQIIVRMMAHGDLFNFEYMTSHNLISPGGFTNGLGYNPNNVNYDYDSTGVRMDPSNNPAAWAQNIANGFLDPRPPVFIRTNANPAFPADSRFYIDLNHNGRFETNGLLPYIKDDGSPLVTGGVTTYNFVNGEPEWIGVLQYPGVPQSATNRYVGRYAVLVLPIGKMLDYNFIHNYSKSLVSVTPGMPPSGSTSADQFVRDQGVGPWELNLAGLLWGVDNNPYSLPGGTPYHYSQGITPNTGYAFDDAYSFLRFRYAGNSGAPYNYGAPYPLPLNNFVGAGTPNLIGIDEYGPGGMFPAFNYNALGFPWPGSFSTNNFYNIQDVFDTNKTSAGFVGRLLSAGAQTNSYDRYMFQRMLATIGYSSVPELQTYVYGDVVTTDPSTPPTVLRTKVNLNWDNTWQIVNGLNTSPTNLIRWTQEPGGALGFFTNAAESLLRSQNFRITNYDTLGNPLSVAYIHFGVTNIPIYSSFGGIVNPSIRYTEQIHRMLQLAANIYDATRTDTVVPTGQLPHPSVFRPIFRTTNYGGTNQVLIAGYASVTNDAQARIQSIYLSGMKLPADPSIAANDNVWGIPWVIGAVKGLPAFDRFTADTSWMVTRKLLFKRYALAASGPGASIGDPTKPPQFTNQFFIMSITNNFGIDAWNAYAANINGSFKIIASTQVSIGVTNNSALDPCWFGTNYVVATNSPVMNTWRGYGSRANPLPTDGMLGFLQTNIASLQSAYFSEYARQFVPVYGLTNPSSSVFAYNLGSFLPDDLQQSQTNKGWPFYNWVLTVTNRVMYALLDMSGPTPQAVDFVNLGPFGTAFNLTNILFSGTSAGSIPVQGSGAPASAATYWNPYFVNQYLPCIGVLNQISNGMQLDPYFASEIRGSVTNRSTSSSNLYFSCSNDVAATYPTPPNPAVWASTLLVNDPLVHYMVGDLTRPGGDGSQILTDNKRYEPWPLNDTQAEQQFSGYNMTLKDPQILSSDDWNFHTNLFPSIGGLGRVHRGTPWQTIFLKADPAPVVNGVNQNQRAWTGNWVSTLDTYPTNDYALLDLFTTAPSDNAARGLLSVNQTNNAPWYALFAGVAVSNGPPYPGHWIGPQPGTTNLDPTAIDPLLDGMYLPGVQDSNGGWITNYIPGINAIRNAQPDGVFRHIGAIFNAPALTVESPFLPAPPGMLKDEEVEAIPQQVAGLLKLGMPQFVIYGFGQALKPKDIYFGSSPSLFNLCTNYQITGEYVTRYVCHVVGDPAAANVKIQVDSVNILPAD